MKRIFMILAAAAGFMMAACDTVEQAGNDDSYDDVAPKDSLVFNATFDTQTKTYMNYNSYYGSYELLWAPEDEILIWDGESLEGDNPQYEFCTLMSGAGTSGAEFVGTLDADTYLALYAWNYDWPYEGYPCIYYAASQYLTREGNIDDYTLPMIAVSDSRTLHFENVASVLKISVTGNGEKLSRITVYSKDDTPVSGWAILGFDANNNYEPVHRFLDGVEDSPVYSYTDLYCYEYELSSDPLECYIVVPAQEWEEGLGVRFQTDDGRIMEVSTAAGIETKRSQVHEIPVVEFEGEEISIDDILGEYSASGEDYYEKYDSWTTTIYKDGSVDNRVWISGLTKYPPFDVYGDILKMITQCYT